jgi:hypothetical protein
MLSAAVQQAVGARIFAVLTYKTQELGVGFIALTQRSLT